MKQLARRASLVAALLLLASVGTALAECAWVLWGVDLRYSRAAQERIPPEAWRPQNGYQSAELCYAASKSMESVGGEPSKSAYICLPDTTDPRGPKTK